MNMKTTPTVEQLNAAQAEWMKLDSNGPEKEKKRVIALYEAAVPKSYLNVTDDKAMAGLIIDGTPMWANRRPLAEAIEAAKQFGSHLFSPKQIRTDVAWCGGKGEWVSL